MKTVLFDKINQTTFIYSCRSDLSKKIGRKETTLWKWAKNPFKETKEYILYFNCEEMKSKNKKGNESNFSGNKGNTERYNDY